MAVLKPYGSGCVSMKISERIRMHRENDDERSRCPRVSSGADAGRTQRPCVAWPGPRLALGRLGWAHVWRGREEMALGPIVFCNYTVFFPFPEMIIYFQNSQRKGIK